MAAMTIQTGPIGVEEAVKSAVERESKWRRCERFEYAVNGIDMTPNKLPVYRKGAVRVADNLTLPPLPADLSCQVLFPPIPAIWFIHLQVSSLGRQDLLINDCRWEVPSLICLLD
jgi:hypothetical protein